MLKSGSQPSDGEEQNRTVWAGYTALGWVIIFLGFHVYWAFGGRFGLGDASAPLPAFPHSVGAWLFTIIVSGMTYAQITGDSQISAYTLWSGRGIDVYFLLGGILYGIAAWQR